MNRKPSDEPEKLPTAFAKRSCPWNAAGSVAGTFLPEPRGSAGPIASHRTEASITAGVVAVPRKTKES